MSKRRRRLPKLPKVVERHAHRLIKSQLLTLFLALFILGYWVGTRVNHDARAAHVDELFDHLAVVSYRDSPTDSTGHFVAELSAGSHVFRRYDIDRRRFEAPLRGRDYRLSINGTHYGTLVVRGHVDRGFWLELPTVESPTFRPDQFTELYRSTVDYLKPVSILTTVLGTLSGYSVGFHLATWSTSFANPMVQDRLLDTPGIGRRVAREAWRRVLLEPVLMDDGNDAARFAALRGTQRIYTNFYRLALHDSDSFIPREAARLDSLGRPRAATAMRAFANAARRAASDTCDLTSADFTAVEEWASLLDRLGGWAPDALPSAGEARMHYLGTLSWYGLAPATPDERRLWIGPRVLVSEGGTAGFIADDLPLTGAGCPGSWRPWLQQNHDLLESNVWTAQWMGAREWAPVIQAGRSLGANLHIGR